jgi:hypothetical protein
MTDKQILSLIEQSKNASLIQNFNKLITNERMVVNYLKMFLISGIKPIQTYIFQ